MRDMAKPIQTREPPEVLDSLEPIFHFQAWALAWRSLEEDLEVRHRQHLPDEAAAAGHLRSFPAAERLFRLLQSLEPVQLAMAAIFQDFLGMAWVVCLAEGTTSDSLEWPDPSYLQEAYLSHSTSGTTRRPQLTWLFWITATGAHRNYWWRQLRWTLLATSQAQHFSRCGPRSLRITKAATSKLQAGEVRRLVCLWNFRGHSRCSLDQANLLGFYTFVDVSLYNVWLSLDGAGYSMRASSVCDPGLM